MFRRLSLALAAPSLGLALVAGSKCLCRAQESETSAQQNKIEKALESPAELEFIETPLDAVVEHLAKQHGIGIQVDRDVLFDAGMVTEIPITKNVKGISLRSVLRLMLRDLDLVYVVQDKGLLITTREKAAKTLSIRGYPVDDLLGHGEASESRNVVCGSLINAITKCIAPESWKQAGGRVSISTSPPDAPKSLVIEQSIQAHEQISGLLARLRLLARTKTGLTPGEKKIFNALNSPTELEFIEVPLQDLLDYLRDYHEIEIQIDQMALDDVGIGTDAPVTENLRGITLRSALRLTLRELELTYVVQDEVLLIVTPEEANKRLFTRVYPVDGLVNTGEASVSRRLDFDSLIQIIWACLEPDARKRGAVAAIPQGPARSLVVMHNYRTHEQIADLLQRLRCAGQREAGDKLSPAAAVEKRIADALKSPTDLEFIETPLDDVLHYLSGRHAIQIQIDESALDEVAIGTDTPITENLKNIRLRAGLQRMLGKIDLTYVVRNEVLLVTTPEEAERLYTEVYALDTEIARGAFSAAGYLDRDALVNTLPKLIAPKSWRETGAKGTITVVSLGQAEALVIRQSYPVHERIARWLGRRGIRN